MKTIQKYTSEDFTSKKGNLFNIYKGSNNIGQTIFTIRDNKKNEIGFRKSKNAIENFLNKN